VFKPLSRAFIYEPGISTPGSYISALDNGVRIWSDISKKERDAVCTRFYKKFNHKGWGRSGYQALLRRLIEDHNMGLKKEVIDADVGTPSYYEGVPTVHSGVFRVQMLVSPAAPSVCHDGC
jgi:hypothetical protein